MGREVHDYVISMGTTCAVLLSLSLILSCSFKKLHVDHMDCEWSAVVACQLEMM